MILSKLGPLDSEQAHQLYQHAGEDGLIRVGLYGDKELSITEANEKMLEKLDKLLPSIKKSTKVLIIGAGYGVSARFLAEKYNCKIDCLNIDPLQNEFNEEKNKAAELNNYITITEGGFDRVPHVGEDYDIILAQDILLFAEDKIRLFREAARALKPEGRFIFTAIMEKEMNFGQDLEELLAYLQIEELTTLSLYKRMANQADLEQVYILELPEEFGKHFKNFQNKIQSADKKATAKIKSATLDQANKGLQLWLEAYEKGLLNWGILQFQKRNV